jgi:hypothetical protein
VQPIYFLPAFNVAGLIDPALIDPALIDPALIDPGLKRAGFTAPAVADPVAGDVATRAFLVAFKLLSRDFF